jgi:Asp/Glu/hydantoin racemase
LIVQNLYRLNNLEKFDFGESIGIITWKRWYPALIHGHHNYAATYEFPVRIKFIENWRAPEEKRDEWFGWNVPEYIKIAKELESEGVSAICTNCGITGTLQPILTEEVNIPVFTSSLLQVPHVHQMLGKNKKVGILIHSSNRAHTQNQRLLKSCGIDEKIPIAVYGMSESEWADIWRTQFNFPQGEPSKEYDPKIVGNALVSNAKKMISENPNIGAIVLECTEMPLYAAAVREATGLLVFDSSTQVRYVYHAIAKKKYY